MWVLLCGICRRCFFFTATSPTEIYTLSLHDALPIYPIGRWRERYRGGLAIDASGKLFGEAEFKDIEQFKDAILARPEKFIRAFSEHLLSYALGRELKVTDKPAIDRITRRVLADHGRFSTVVVEVAKSMPFRHKTGQNERK